MSRERWTFFCLGVLASNVFHDTIQNLWPVVIFDVFGFLLVVMLCTEPSQWRWKP